jgi:hypothetical protein
VNDEARAPAWSVAETADGESAADDGLTGPAVLDSDGVVGAAVFDSQGDDDVVDSA